MLVAVLFATACGGSSSETPFPVEPDWRREAKSSGPSRELVFSGAEGESDEEGDEPLEAEPGEAAPTWGGTEAEPEPAPRPKSRPKSDEELELELR
jgi:hypothetical protein